MNNQELYAKGFKEGWNKHRKYICKEYGLDENTLISFENQENEK